MISPVDLKSLQRAEGTPRVRAAVYLFNIVRSDMNRRHGGAVFIHTCLPNAAKIACGI
jgi:hypothetical protein